MRLLAVLTLAAVPALLGCGEAKRPAPDTSFTATGWSRVQYFEGRTFHGDQSLNTEEGLIDPVRQDAIVRLQDANGKLVAESAALDTMTLVRAPAGSSWSVAKRRDYRPLFAALNVPAGIAAEPRPFDPRRQPLGWSLEGADRAAELRVPGERAAALLDTTARTTAAVLGDTLPRVSAEAPVVWRRWWRDERLVAEELRITVIADLARPRDTAEMTRSITFTEAPDDLGDIYPYALALGWDEVVMAAVPAHRRLFGETTTFAVHTPASSTRFVRDPAVARPSSIPQIGFAAGAAAEGYEPLPSERSGVRRRPGGPVAPRRGPGAVRVGVGVAVGAGVAIGIAACAAELDYYYRLYQGWKGVGEAIGRKATESERSIDALTIPPKSPQATATPTPATHPAVTRRRPVSPDAFWESAARFRRPPPPVEHPDDCLEPWEKRQMLDEWPYEYHHVATVESPPNPGSGRTTDWTPLFEAVLQEHFGENAPDLDDDWNIMYVRHKASDCSNGGGHAEGYHQWVLDNMRELAAQANGNVEWFKSEWRRVMKEIYRDPTIMTCDYWDCVR